MIVQPRGKVVQPRAGSDGRAAWVERTGPGDLEGERGRRDISEDHSEQLGEWEGHQPSEAPAGHPAVLTLGL